MAADDVQEQRGNNAGGVTGKGFLPGRSGNPGGRPKGRSLTAILRDALDREAEGSPGKTVGEVIVERLLTLTADDRRAIKDVFDRTEGRPVQSVDQTHSGALTVRVLYDDPGHSPAATPPGPAGDPGDL